jgi:hypothetical protein
MGAGLVLLETPEVKVFTSPSTWLEKPCTPVIPSAWITGQGWLERLAAGLFRATGQAGALELVLPGMKRRIAESGFEVRHELVEAEGSRVLVVIGEKQETKNKRGGERR